MLHSVRDIPGQGRDIRLQYVGKDVAQVLGYNDTNQAIRKHVDDEDKLTRQIDGSGQNRDMTIIKAVRDHVDDEDRTVNDSLTVNGTQGVLINESGLYSLILSSKLPGAVARSGKRVSHK